MNKLLLSQIYSMTLRLSNLFEAQLKAMMGKRTANTPKRKPTRTTNRRPRRPAAGASNPQPGTSRELVESRSETEDDLLSPRMVRVIMRGGMPHQNGNSATAYPAQAPSDPIPGPSTASSRPTRRPQHNVQQPVASTSTAHVVASSSRGTRNVNNGADRHENEDSDDSDVFNGSSSTSDSEGSAEDRPLAPVGGATRSSHSRRRPHAASDPSYSDDSEESYNPSARGSRPIAKRNVGGSAKKRRPDKNGSKPARKTNGRVGGDRSKRNRKQNEDEHMSDDDDDDDEDEDLQVDETDDEPDMVDEDDANDEDYNVNTTPKKSRTARPTRAKRNVLDSSSDENSKRRSARKPQRYESDHSYHLNANTSNGNNTHRRRIHMESDPEPEQTTRSRRIRPPITSSQQVNAYLCIHYIRIFSITKTVIVL